MAKKYGGRWEIVKEVGKGGQGDVFEARDTLPSSDGAIVALKRVKNPNRHSRFRNEVAAIKTLSHPNVIKLIDHSALDTESDAPEKQYIVMPLARGGDLSKRVSMYEGNLDGTLIVAKQIASALEAAHALGIVHRDVKPQNILFPEQSNEIWLTDFGICFVLDGVRPTGDEEVVGPWAFMAPELEHGGTLQVRPSADVYSLGKLIYYMVSGGVVVPREQLFEPPYAAVFAAGGRYHLLNLLLRKMVCNVSTRLTDMSDVIVELDRIADWDENSALVPVTSKTRSKLQAMQSAVLQNREVAEKNRANVQAQQAAETQVQAHLMDWLQNELEKAAVEISGGGVISTSIQPVAEPDLTAVRFNNFRAVCGIELVVSRVSEKTNLHHALQIFFCSEFKVTIRQVTESELESVVTPEARTIGILPVYCIRSPDASVRRAGSRSRYFFGTGDKLIPVPEMVTPHALNQSQQRTRVGPGTGVTSALFNSFPSSAWPGGEYTMREFVGVCCDRFVDSVSRYKDAIFLPPNGIPH